MKNAIKTIFKVLFWVPIFIGCLLFLYVQFDMLLNKVKSQIKEKKKARENKWEL